MNANGQRKAAEVPSPGAAADTRPLVVSLCGTYLKPEMQSIYRQIANLRNFRTVVVTEQIANRDAFPFDDVIEMEKRTRPRRRGNFLLRFWFKHVVRKWPPPRPIGHVGREGAYYDPYNLPEIMAELQPRLAHVYYGHKAVKYHRMLRGWGGPFIVSFHGVDVVKFMERKGYPEKMRRVLHDAQLVLARSESLLEEVAALGCPREKLRLNRTPIPLDAIPAALRTASDDGAWRLVQASRLVAKKGLFTTLEALKQVVPQQPKLKFVVCGRGPVEAEFSAAVQRAGMSGNVEMLGWLGQDALRDELRRAHVFLHPSELTETSDQEGIPNSMLEAMASGLPVVATRHGGIPEAVTDGEDGLLVAEKSPDELADAILRLLGDGALLRKLSVGAAESVRRKFGLGEQVAALERCYAEAISKFESTGPDVSR